MNELIVFQWNNIRRTLYNNENYFCIEDAVRVLTNSKDPKQYIQRLKQRNQRLKEGWVQIVRTLPINTTGGTQKVLCANIEGLFRIIQSIPSNKTEQFKKWFYQVRDKQVLEIPNTEPGQTEKDNIEHLPLSTQLIIENKNSDYYENIIQHLSEFRTKSYTKGINKITLLNEIAQYIQSANEFENNDYRHILNDFTEGFLNSLIGILQSKQSNIITDRHRQYNLTNKQLQIVKYILKQYTYPEIMKEMNISKGNLSNCITNICYKIGIYENIGIKTLRKTLLQ